MRFEAPSNPHPRARLLGRPAVIVAALAVAAATALAATPAVAQTRGLGASGELLDRIAVVVNDGVVLQSQVDQQVALITQRLRQQGTPLPPASVLRQQITERLVLQEIQLQRAQRVGLRVGDEALNNAVRDVARQNNIEFSRLPDVLAAEGINYAEYREQMRREMTLSLLRQRDVFARIYVSPRELDQFVAKQAQDAAGDDLYEVSHILLSLPEAASPGQLDEVEKKAEDVYARAQRGEDFGQLAVAYSQAQTALERGKIGWRKGTELPTFMADVVKQLKPGEVSRPVRTPSGFHVIRLDAEKSDDQPVIVEQINARHILVKPNELQDDETVRGRLAGIRDRIAKGTEDFAAIAKAVSEDPGSAAEGGDLGWTSPGTFVPEFEQALASLAEGEISQPFRTQYGWHIAQLIGKRTQDMSSEERRRRAFEQLRASKADEETELWLRRLRDEAFVDYRM
ncbi:MAG: peptidylprolyl isomerase [Steroidobacteraceae bacterium]|jgi:peptidyl-prolyl cis-trans isomerase SurA|nr:peptidylprolyl isomerase [Steroidobacteraceae bacterium]